MAAFQKFNPVNFSKNITNTISAVDAKIGNVTSAPQTLTAQLNAKTGLNIAAPPLPPINANVRGLVGSVKTLVKNPGGVVKDGISAASGAANSKLTNINLSTLGSSVKAVVQGGVSNAAGSVTGFATAKFGTASAAVRGSLNQINGTLRVGIKNCLNNAVSSLLSSITMPNIPFGGISIAGAVGALSINKKINKFLNAEITLIGNLQQKKLSLVATVSGRLGVLKDIKSTNYYTGKITSEINNSVNNACNTLSPRNKKMLSRGGPIVEMVARSAASKAINNLENQVVRAASGFSAKSATEFFNSATGKPIAVVNAASGRLTAAAAVVTSIPASIGSKTTQAYNNINDAINSNVPKQG
jgi:hypothetical protein